MNSSTNKQQQKANDAYKLLYAACPQLAEKITYLKPQVSKFKTLSRSVLDDPSTNLVKSNRLAIDGDFLVKRIDAHRHKREIMDIELPPSVDAIFGCPGGPLFLVEFKNVPLGKPKKKSDTFKFTRNQRAYGGVVNFNRAIHRKFLETVNCLVLEEAITVKELRNNAIGLVVTKGSKNNLSHYEKTSTSRFAQGVRGFSGYPKAAPQLHGWLLFNSFVVDEKIFDNVMNSL